MLACFVIFFTCLLGEPGVLQAQELALVETWCDENSVPTRMAFNETDGLLYVTSPATAEIKAYDLDGNLINTLTTLAHPGAICCDALGHLVVQDGPTVCKLTTAGSVLMLISDPQLLPGEIHDVAAAADGRIFVAVEFPGPLVSDSILVFDASGARVGGFRGFGRWWSYLNVAVSLEINERLGELYLVDQDHYRILSYRLDGTQRYDWGSSGQGHPVAGQFLRAWGMSIDEADRVWVLDAVARALHVFDHHGTPLYYLPIPGDLWTGVDVVVRNNRIYLTAQSAHCVQVYDLVMPPPTVVTELTVIPNSGAVVLHWKGVANANGYRVLRSSVMDFAENGTETLDAGTDTFYVDATAPATMNTAYYRVVALTDVATAGESAAVLPEWEEDPSVMFRHDRPHQVQDGVDCNSCHYSNLNLPRPRPARWFSDVLCKSCHVETGMAQAVEYHVVGDDTMHCRVCHNPHDQQLQYPHYLIRTAFETPNSGDRVLSFNHATDFVHGAPNYDGICETCHTQTDYYRNDASGDHTHNEGANCLDCHAHERGFLPIQTVLRD